MSLPTRLKQGESPTFRFELSSANACDAFDLANYDLFFYIKRSLQDSDEAAEFVGIEDDGITFPYEDTDGIVDVTIPASVTAALQTGRLYPFYFVVQHIVSNDRVYLPARGQFLVMPPMGTEIAGGVLTSVGGPDNIVTIYRITEAGAVRQFEDGSLVIDE